MKSRTAIESLGRTMVRLGLMGTLLTAGATVAVAQRPDIDMASMNGGETYRAGTFAQVTWHASGLDGDVAISLWDAARCVWIPIAATVPAAAGQFTWRIPGDLTGDRFRVKIQSLEHQGVCRMGGSFFGIEAAAGSTAGLEVTQEGTGVDLDIRPNPASDRVELASRRLAGADCRVRNLQGEIVRDFGRSDGDARSISVDGLPSGIYLLEMQFRDGALVVRKLVVQR